MHPVWFFLNGVPTGGVIAPSRLVLGTSTISSPAADAIGVFPDAAERFRFTTSGLLINSSETVAWGSPLTSPDVTIGRGAAGTLTLMGSTATPAGGSTSLRLVFGSTAGFGIYIGSGAPTVSAAQGSLYLRSNGTGTGDRAYINTNGSTTWTALTTAA